MCPMRLRFAALACTVAAAAADTGASRAPLWCFDRADDGDDNAARESSSSNVPIIVIFIRQMESKGRNNYFKSYRPMQFWAF